MPLRCFFALLLLTCFGSVSRADIMVYTDPTAFAAAIAGRASTTVDFESESVGDTIADGAALGGLEFDYTWGSGESLRVNDDFSTTSGTRYLGATSGPFGADLMTDFNDFEITPSAPASALGLFIVAPFELFEEELLLSAGGETAMLADTPLGTLGDGSFTYFLGLAGDETDTIGTVTLSASIDSFLAEYRVDDITFADAITAVPEPTSLTLVASSLLLCSIRRRRDNKAA